MDRVSKIQERDTDFGPEKEKYDWTHSGRAQFPNVFTVSNNLLKLKNARL